MLWIRGGGGEGFYVMNESMIGVRAAELPRGVTYQASGVGSCVYYTWARAGR